MAEYIDKDKLVDRFDELCNMICQYSKKQRSVMCGACELGSAVDVIDDFPTENVQPVKWIPIEDMLPKIDKDVLVYARGNKMRVWCMINDDGSMVWEDEHGYWEDFDAVSHWMPLPELPKDGEI